MQLLKRGFKKFITFGTVGLIYDIMGTVAVTLFYSPVKPHKYSDVGGENLALFSKDNFFLYLGLWMIIIGFIFLLFDQIFDLGKKKYKQNTLRALVIIPMLFLSALLAPIILIFLFILGVLGTSGLSFLLKSDINKLIIPRISILLNDYILYFIFITLVFSMSGRELASFLNSLLKFMRDIIKMLFRVCRPRKKN